MGKQVNREDFLRQLQAVSYGLSAKEIQEQSNALIFLNGEMCSFNDEICCRAPSPLGDFTGAIKAQKLIEILEKRVDDDLEVEAKDGKLFVRGKGGTSWVYAEAEIRLPIDQVEQCETWRPLSDEFSDAVKIVQECAGHDASMPDTLHIHIHPKFMEAFDDFQFIRYKMATGVERPTQVKRDSLKCIVQLGLNELGETDNWLHFRSTTTGLVFSCRRYLDDYRDLAPVFKVDQGETLQLPKTLMESVERAEVFSSEEQENEVRVELRPGKIRVKGLGASGGHWESKKITYKGKPCGFLMSPKLLVQLPERGIMAHLTENRLWVNGGKYRYVTILQPLENGNGTE